MGILIDIVNNEQLCDLMCGKPEEEDEEMKEGFKCFNCGCDSVIHQSDFTFSDYGIDDKIGFVQIYHCPNCDAEIEYRVPITEKDIKELKEKNEN